MYKLFIATGLVYRVDSKDPPLEKKNCLKKKCLAQGGPFSIKSCQASFNACKMTISIITGWILVKCKICGIVERALHLVSEEFCK